MADRGFPSALLFALLRQRGTRFSVRLRLSDWVMRRAGLYDGRGAFGSRTAGGRAADRGDDGRGRPDQPLVPGWVVVSTAVVAPPKHKQNPGTARERAQRAKAHAQHRAHKQGRKTKPPRPRRSAMPRPGCSSLRAPTVSQAVAEYAQRMPIEETFRDWHSGWGVRAAVVDLPTEAMVDRLIGVVCRPIVCRCRWVSDSVQTRRAAAPGAMDGHGSGESFWCGQRPNDPGYDWRGWLAAQWEALTLPPASVVSEPESVPMLAEAA